ncbi:MAG: DUF547 domain-containing protein [Myxococcota bacterium]
MFRRAIYALAAAMVLFAGVVLWVDGHVPAAVPTDAPALEMSDLVDALRAIDGRGQVNLAELKQRHASLERFVAALAATSPDTTPARFPTVEAKLAFWLNAYHALVLRELLDVRGTKASRAAELADAVPIGGRWWTRAAIYRHFLSQSGDARVYLALFTGAKGRGVLDGAPFDGDSLDPQLDDAVRRFVRRKDHVDLEGKTVKLSALFREHHDEFLAALPDERKNVLQIVWAYLPESCPEGSPGCATRGELDRACGPRFDACQLDYQPVDQTLATRN